MTSHEISIYPVFFNAVVNGKKNFELRKFRPNVRVGDYIKFNEVLSRGGECTGRSVLALITFIYTSEEFLKEGYSIISFKLVSDRTYTTRIQLLLEDLSGAPDSPLKEIIEEITTVNMRLQSQVESDRQFRQFVASKIDKAIPTLNHEDKKDLEDISNGIKHRNREDI